MMYVVRGFKPHGWTFTGFRRSLTEQWARAIAHQESTKRGQRNRVYAVDAYDPVKDEWKRVVAYVNGTVVSGRRALVGDMEAMKMLDAKQRDLEEARKVRAEHYADKDKRIRALVADGRPRKEIKKTLHTSDHYIAKVLARAGES